MWPREVVPLLRGMCFTTLWQNRPGVKTIRQFFCFVILCNDYALLFLDVDLYSLNIHD